MVHGDGMRGAFVLPVGYRDVVDDTFIDVVATHGFPCGRRYGQPNVEATHDGEGLDRLLDDLDRDGSTRDILLDWLPRRFAYVRAAMERVASTGDGQLRIWRNITVDAVAAGAVRDGTATGPLGEFWSYDPGADVGTPWSNGDGQVLRMEALVDVDLVDWVTTMRRNMNYLNGDDEAEISLVTGTVVILVGLEHGGDPVGPILSPLRQAGGTDPGTSPGMAPT